MFTFVLVEINFKAFGFRARLLHVQSNIVLPPCLLKYESSSAASGTFVIFWLVLEKWPARLRIPTIGSVIGASAILWSSGFLGFLYQIDASRSRCSCDKVTPMSCASRGPVTVLTVLGNSVDIMITY